MYKDYRYINAGINEIYRYGKKAQEYVKGAMVEHDGYYSIATDGGKYWTIGTSEGKFGEFCKFRDTIFSVNRGGYAYAKVGTDKGDKFIEMLEQMLAEMIDKNNSRFDDLDEEEMEKKEVKC